MFAIFRFWLMTFSTCGKSDGFNQLWNG